MSHLARVLFSVCHARHQSISTTQPWLVEAALWLKWQHVGTCSSSSASATRLNEVSNEMNSFSQELVSLDAAKVQDCLSREGVRSEKSLPEDILKDEATETASAAMSCVVSFPSSLEPTLNGFKCYKPYKWLDRHHDMPHSKVRIASLKVRTYAKKFWRYFSEEPNLLSDIWIDAAGLRISKFFESWSFPLEHCLRQGGIRLHLGGFSDEPSRRDLRAARPRTTLFRFLCSGPSFNRSL